MSVEIEIEPMKHLDKYRIILGSQSPRRKELLEGLGLRFEQRAIPDLDECYPSSLPTREIAEYLARHKAAVYAPTLASDELLITADTIVLLEEDVLGKPQDEEEARAMLTRLAGRSHEVVTGVCVSTVKQMASLSSCTRVYFEPIPSHAIDYYVSTYHPLDKAGSYGIQEWIGYRFISRIEGCYYNVMGLPVQQLAGLLTAF